MNDMENGSTQESSSSASSGLTRKNFSSDGEWEFVQDMQRQFGGSRQSQQPSQPPAQPRSSTPSPRPQSAPVPQAGSSVRDVSQHPEVMKAYHKGNPAAAAVVEAAARVEQEGSFAQKGSVDEYIQFQMPPGSGFDAEDRAVVVSLAREAKVPAAALSAIVGDYAMNAHLDRQARDADAATAVLKSVWGTAFETNMERVNQFLDKHLGLKTYVMNNPSLGNSPALGIAILAHLGRAQSSQQQIDT